MLPAILKKLQNNTIVQSNIIDPESVDILSNTSLSNTMLLEVAISLMAKSPNSIIQIIYHIIKDNPYAIFLFVVISVFIFTVFLRFLFYIIPIYSYRIFIRYYYRSRFS